MYSKKIKKRKENNRVGGFPFLSSASTTYHEFPHILRQPGGQHVKDAIHAQVANLGQADQLVIIGQESGE